MTNKKLGNDFEREFCTMLAEKGFWAHNMIQSAMGQPADIVAVKNGKAYLIDCKVCSKRGFALSRVEENQDLAMWVWKEKGNGDGWFAIKTSEGYLYMIPHFAITRLREVKSTMNHKDLEKFGVTFERWVKLCK